MNKGKLIVIEGNDGAGKSTQFKLLRDRLKLGGTRIETIKFPQHGTTFFGRMVDDYLNGSFGDAAKLHPYLASVLYAADRWQAKDTMDAWLAEGSILLLDRYMTANKGHQVGKLGSDKERLACLDWLDEMEYEVFGIPRPDIVLFLDVSAEKCVELMAQRDSAGKEYIQGKHDGLENLEHLKQSRKAFQFTAGQYDYWHAIDCMDGTELLSPETIHEKIWGITQKYL